jgi:ribosomal-protein-alanine N-acetyltransferase
VRPAPEASRGAAPAPAGLAVGPLEDRHLDEVVAIEAAVYPRPWSLATFREELARDDRRYLVALVDDDGRGDVEVAGYAGLAVLVDEAHVLTVAVAPAWQRRGIGARLVDALLAEAVAAGVGAVTLEVRASDEATQRLYRRAGFAAAGVRPGYYADDGDDAVLMWWYAPGTDPGAGPDDGGR